MFIFGWTIPLRRSMLIRNIWENVFCKVSQNGLVIYTWGFAERMFRSWRQISFHALLTMKSANGAHLWFWMSLCLLVCCWCPWGHAPCSFVPIFLRSMCSWIKQLIKIRILPPCGNGTGFLISRGERDRIAVMNKWALNWDISVR